MDVEKILALLKEMERRQVDYVLVGGVAMGLHGLVRATEDVDLFVRPEPDNVRRLKDALRAIWDDPDIEQIGAGDLSGEYATIRYAPPGESFAVDLLSRLGSAVSFDDLRAETIIFEGVSVRLATPETLYRMKRDTVRPIDRADAAALREKFGLRGE
jgi:nucleotidyltransferase AbiEii toxin of type IV toxin-antitoxin system